MLNMRNTVVTPELQALVASTDTLIEFDGSDERSVMVVNASAATTLTVKAGDSFMASEPLVLDIPKGVSLIKLDSGRFKNVKGANKGKITVNSAGTPSIAIVEIV